MKHIHHFRVPIVTEIHMTISLHAKVLHLDGLKIEIRRGISMNEIPMNLKESIVIILKIKVFSQLFLGNGVCILLKRKRIETFA